MARPLIDMKGLRKFRLTVVEYAGPPGLWRIRCDCGTERLVRRGWILQSKSCGCYNREAIIARNYRHGDSARGKVAPELQCWRGLIRRCTDPGDEAYAYYGGRGIAVCDRWLNSYPAFLEDMGRRPSPKHSIDRVNNDGNYEPSNCEWALSKQQMRNRRGRRKVNFQGRSMPASEAAELAGISYDIFLERINRGWETERALLTPAMAAFGGTGVDRFSHSSEALSLVKVASAIKAYNDLSESERGVFERVIEP